MKFKILLLTLTLMACNSHEPPVFTRALRTEIDGKLGQWTIISHLQSDIAENHMHSALLQYITKHENIGTTPQAIKDSLIKFGDISSIMLIAYEELETPRFLNLTE